MSATSTIDEQVAAARSSLTARLADLEQLYRDEKESIADDHVAELERIMAEHQKTRCPDCAGSGAVYRLDAAVMRRFGLQEWDGCKRCGGTRTDRGRGYL